ncbi:MAG TPA: tetratricopeptide repeat protein, partial [Minicystis sp.]|nr:tetratricopeptide repeat protein [Minicystis sp.]
KIKENDPEGLALVGRAAHLLRSARDANDAYNQAEKVGAKKLVEPLLWRAELFLDKYDPGHAGEVVREALKLAPKDPNAHVMMARVRLENGLDFEAAESEVAQALEVNPNLASAYFIRAGLALRDLDVAAADKAADQGLKIDPQDLELLAMKAAIRFLADDPAGFDQWKKKAFAVDPEYSAFYQIVGEFAEWEHRYDDIVRMMREAIKVDPADAKARAALGLNLIRAGDDAGGLAELRKAWEMDKFNVRVYNTLNTFEKVIANDYVTVKGTTFNIRYNKEEKPVLERYVPQMLEEAWTSMVKRYGFTPKTPVGIELYADGESFSVRTSGLPNVGIQGVCFGQTLAAMSPSAGPFNWGNVLWHELGHVFAIQMSKSHVPRWFTEGLSEYETIIRRPEWQREEDPALYAALKGGRVPEVAAFNRAFTHVSDVSDVTMAYYAASQIQVFLAQEFGFPKIVAMLPKWGAGERTPEVVKDVLGISAEELDHRYRAWLGQRLARYTHQYVPDLHAPPLDDARKAVQKEPKNAKRYVELALALLADGQGDEADATLSEALRIDPKQPDAHYVRLRMAIGKKDAAEAARLVNKMIADGNDGYAIRMK